MYIHDERKLNGQYIVGINSRWQSTDQWSLVNNYRYFYNPIPNNRMVVKQYCDYRQIWFCWRITLRDYLPIWLLYFYCIGNLVFCNMHLNSCSCLIQNELCYHVKFRKKIEMLKADKNSPVFIWLGIMSLRLTCYAWYRSVFKGPQLRSSRVPQKGKDSQTYVMCSWHEQRKYNVSIGPESVGSFTPHVYACHLIALVSH